MTRTRSRLGRRLAWLFAFDLAVTVTAAAAAAAYEASPWFVAAVAGAVAGLLVLLTLRSPLRRIDASLAALRDGALSFAAGDFSLRLRVVGDDEISGLVRLYNEVGDALRTQRNRSLQRELLFETILHATPLAVVLTAAEGRVVYANRSARDLIVGGEALEGRRFDEILDLAPALREAFGAERDALFTSANEQYHLAHRTFSLNGQPHELWIADRLTPEVRRQEVEVWKRAIRVMSHELNNSLAPIRSLFHSARVIRNRHDQWHRMDEIGAAVEERLDYLQQFLGAYAAFARLPKPQREPTRWIDLLRAVQTIVPFQIADPLPSHCGKVDRAQVEQVVINLVKNAAEANSARDAILVAVERRAAGSVLIVSDRGEGMTDEGVVRAALPFWSTKPGGSGLGLALCSEIADAHGGTLRIARRQGGGMIVTCWFPDGGRGETIA